LRERHLYIHRILSILLLWVFTIALTPFGALHHHDHDHDHEPKCVTKEKTCTHKLHVSSQTEHCLICKAHFEKNYITTKQYVQVYTVSKPVTRVYHITSGSYIKLIDLALRGPPTA